MIFGILFQDNVGTQIRMQDFDGFWVLVQSDSSLENSFIYTLEFSYQPITHAIPTGQCFLFSSEFAAMTAVMNAVPAAMSPTTVGPWATTIPSSSTDIVPTVNVAIDEAGGSEEESTGVVGFAVNVNMVFPPTTAVTPPMTSFSENPAAPETTTTSGTPGTTLPEVPYSYMPVLESGRRRKLTLIVIVCRFQHTLWVVFLDL